MNRKVRRANVRIPYEEPWWKWAGVPRFSATPLPKNHRRAVLRGALITAALGALALVLVAGFIWVVRLF